MQKPKAIYKLTEGEVITIMLALEAGIERGKERKEPKMVHDMMTLYERFLIELAMTKSLWEEQSSGGYIQ